MSEASAASSSTSACSVPVSSLASGTWSHSSSTRSRCVVASGAASRPASRPAVSDQRSASGSRFAAFQWYAICAASFIVGAVARPAPSGPFPASRSCIAAARRACTRARSPGSRSS